MHVIRAELPSAAMRAAPFADALRRHHIQLTRSTRLLPINVLCSQQQSFHLAVDKFWPSSVAVVPFRMMCWFCTLHECTHL